MTTPRLPGRKSVLLAGAAVALSVVVAACSSAAAAGSGSDSSAAATGITAPTSAASRTGQGGQAFRPAAQGLIAEVDSGSMQVQGTSSQTTVNWSGTTMFTQTASATLAAVKAGACVQAMAAAPAGTVQGAPAPSRAATKVTTLTAATVTISDPVNGKCGSAGGFGAGGFGQGQGGRPTDLPAPPSRTGSGNGSGRGAGGFAAIGPRVGGTVASVTGTTIVVKATDRSDNSTYDATVTVAATTKYEHTGAVKAAAVKVGLCAVAIGKADSTGAVAATAVALSSPVNGSCTNGFGGRRNRDATAATTTG